MRYGVVELGPKFFDPVHKNVYISGYMAPKRRILDSFLLIIESDSKDFL